MPLKIEQYPAFDDNYLYLITCEQTGTCAAVDPGDAHVIEQALAGRTLDLILNTHHHADHTGGNLALQKRYNCPIYGSVYDGEKDRIPGQTHTLKEGDTVSIGACTARILETPGHTLGHIVYLCEEDNTLFCGDTLFAGGCGRLFEGTAENMFNSLAKLKGLADDTRVFCAHEYTCSNYTFSSTYKLNDSIYKEFLEKYAHMRTQNIPTIPTTLADEKKGNIFFHAQSAAELATFRRAKDNF